MATRSRHELGRWQGPTQAKWESLRPIIEQLYKHENQTERYVREKLREQYSFSVTSKMFKKQIQRWKLDKKRKRSEMLYATRMIERRKESGKSTRIVIRGEEVTEAQIKQYFRRHPLSTSERYLDSGDASPPPDVDCVTPSASPSSFPQNDILMSEGAQPTLAPKLPSTRSSSPKPSFSVVTQGTFNPAHNLIASMAISKKTQLSSFELGGEHPQIRSLSYDLSPHEAFLRQLYEHVRLSTTGALSQIERKSTFRSTSILRAAGWYDRQLRLAIEADETGHLSKAETILKGCARTVTAEVDGYFPDMCVLEMVEILHFLKLRNCRQLELIFMYNLYDDISARLGQFHPLVELLCSAARGYSCSMSASLIPTLLDFLGLHSTSNSDVSLNQLLPLFAFQELRAIDIMPHDLLIHTLSEVRSNPLCKTCEVAVKNSPFQSHDFRLWAARQYVNLLIDIWVEPCVDQTALWHTIRRSRVWRHTWKYPLLSERQEDLRKMNFKERFWAVTKLCFELVTYNIEKTFLECHDELSASIYVDRLAMTTSGKVDLDDDLIQLLCTQVQKSSIFEVDIHSAGNCEHSQCIQAARSLKYWIGKDLCCV